MQVRHLRRSLKSHRNDTSDQYARKAVRFLAQPPTFLETLGQTAGGDGKSQGPSGKANRAGGARLVPVSSKAGEAFARSDQN